VHFCAILNDWVGSWGTFPSVPLFLPPPNHDATTTDNQSVKTVISSASSDQSRCSDPLPPPCCCGCWNSQCCASFLHVTSCAVRSSPSDANIVVRLVKDAVQTSGGGSGCGGGVSVLLSNVCCWTHTSDTHSFCANTHGKTRPILALNVINKPTLKKTATQQKHLCFHL